ncbi:putative C-type lectin domain family 20 member A [Misgurnus anguillicaudatus]|uniref:putative C-type lectin domain family 20 member A n=1 Tax=Misgurnus anguillicaudatus TaxID=75329 RepID=UPI003CCFC097
MLTDQTFTEEMKIVVFALFLSAHCELTVALQRNHFFINEAKTWSDAQKYCRDNYDDLSSVGSQEEYTKINTTLYSWIGLKKTTTNTWQWSDGSDSIFYMWANGQPSNSGNDNLCAVVRNGELYDFHCSLSYPFFCYKWEPELILVREKMSWEDAFEHCRTHYTDLASLPTYSHLIQVNQSISNTETPSVWTGLRFLAGSWFWLTGEDLGNLVDLPACPLNYSYCGSLHLETQRWENRGCMEKLNFVCY